MKRLTLTPLVLALSVSLTACMTLAPSYERPAAPVPDTWPEAAPQQGTPAAKLQWRDYFTDESLRRLIDLALTNNRDLRVAALNVDKLQAQYQIQRASLYPSVNATAAESAQRIPRSMSAKGYDYISRQYSLGVGAAWELDFFGRIQSLKDQALEQYLASEEARRSTQTSLIAETANAYLSLAADSERLHLARETLRSQEESLTLIGKRHAVGSASALDLAQAQSGLEQARADQARYTGLVSQDRNALNLLVGGPIPAELLPTSFTATLVREEELPAGTPSETLLSRPDVLQAERLLRAANANIGSARAAFFPRISLTAAAGVASPLLNDLFQGDTRTWSFAPQISLPIFNAGSNSANLEGAKVDRDIRLAQYEKSIQLAFREVADALAQRANISEQLAAQEALTKAMSDADKLTQLRFDKGIASYLNVLDAQRAHYSARQGLITTQQARQSNLVSLYKVLGGGSLNQPDNKIGN